MSDDDAIPRWKELQPAERGAVMAGLLAKCAKGAAESIVLDNCDDMMAAHLSSLVSTATAIDVLRHCATQACTVLSPSTYDAESKLRDAIARMDSPFQLVANLAILDRSVFPEPFCEALSALVLALRPLPAEAETDPSRAKAKEVVDRIDDDRRVEDLAVDEIRKALDSMAFASPEMRVLHAQRAVDALNVVLHEASLHAKLSKAP